MRINVNKFAYIHIGDRFNADACLVTIDGVPIPLSPEMRYLGLYIISARVFKCDVHKTKVKFFRSLNSIIGKVGTTSAIHLTLSLIATNCNPILLYGLEATGLNKIS